jgi:transcriptional/translational regulatory protein YebC/TACO1
MANPSREDMLRVVKLIDALEDLDDVKETFVNVEIPEELYDES